MKKENAAVLARQLAFLSAAVIAVGALPSPVLAGEARSAKIFSASGTVSVKRGGDKLLSAFEGMRLEEGDIIISEAESSAVIEIDSDKTVSVDENTEIALSALTGDAGTGSTGISVFFGNIVNSIQNKLNKGSTFETETPTAIMGVRGTTYLVGQPIAHPPSVVVSSGSVQADTKSGSTMVEPGFSYEVLSDAPEPLSVEKLVSFGPVAVSALADGGHLENLAGVSDTADLVSAAAQHRAEIREAAAAALPPAEASEAGTYFFETPGAKLSGSAEAQIQPAEDELQAPEAVQQAEPAAEPPAQPLPQNPGADTAPAPAPSVLSNTTANTFSEIKTAAYAQVQTGGSSGQDASGQTDGAAVPSPGIINPGNAQGGSSGNDAETGSRPNRPSGGDFSDGNNNGSGGGNSGDHNNGSGGGSSGDDDNGSGGGTPGDDDNGSGGDTPGGDDNGSGGDTPGGDDNGSGGDTPGDDDNGSGGDTPGDDDNGSGGDTPGDDDNGSGGDTPGDDDNGSGGDTPGDDDNGSGGGDSPDDGDDPPSALPRKPPVADLAAVKQETQVTVSWTALSKNDYYTFTINFADGSHASILLEALSYKNGVYSLTIPLDMLIEDGYESVTVVNKGDGKTTRDSVPVTYHFRDTGGSSLPEADGFRAARNGSSLELTWNAVEFAKKYEAWFTPVDGGKEKNLYPGHSTPMDDGTLLLTLSISEAAEYKKQVDIVAKGDGTKYKDSPRAHFDFSDDVDYGSSGSDAYSFSNLSANIQNGYLAVTWNASGYDEFEVFLSDGSQSTPYPEEIGKYGETYTLYIPAHYYEDFTEVIVKYRSSEDSGRSGQKTANIP